MHSRRILLGIELLLLSPFAAAVGTANTASSTTAFQTVSEDLRKVTFVETDFVEEKTLHILSHPLYSKGTLMFSPQRGVYRVMTEPVHQEMLITRSQLVQKDAQGVVQRMSVRHEPSAHAFVDVLLSFFTGDQGAWHKTFDVSFSGTESEWKIEFVPNRKSPVAKVLSRIILAGREGVLDAMTLTEANGDQTHTAYSHQHVSLGDDGAAAASHFPTDLKAR